MEKTNDFNLARLSVLVLSAVLAVYIFLGLKWGIEYPLAGSVTWGLALGIVTGLVIVGVGYYLSMVHPAAMTFLNETESELRKVVWPKAKPISASTELWQYTIAVIALMVTLVVYIFIVDSVIKELASIVIF